MANMAKILFIPVQNRNDTRHQPPDAAQRERRARGVLVASLIGGLGLFWAGAALSRREDTAGIRALQPNARHSLYVRTFDELSTICREDAAAEGSLHDHCVAQARFIMELPECSDACQRVAASVLPHARR